MALILKTDYSTDPSASRTLGTTLDRDNQAVMDALGGALAGGGGNTGPGRHVGSDYTAGRAFFNEDDGLFLYLPNAVYRIGETDVTVDEPGGFAIIPVPASMANGRFGYLQATDGGVEVLDWRDARAAPPDLDGLPCIGLVKSDADNVLSIDFRFADEIQISAQLLIEIKTLRWVLDALSSPGTGGGSVSGAARADVLPWSIEEPDAMTTTKVLSLIAAAKAELRDYVDAGVTRTMQMPNDAMVEAIVRTRADLIRLMPAAADVVEEALIVFGFAGHAGDGAPPPALPPALGVNGTYNKLRYTTLQVDTLNRRATP